MAQTQSGNFVRASTQYGTANITSGLPSGNSARTQCAWIKFATLPSISNQIYSIVSYGTAATAQASYFTAYYNASNTRFLLDFGGAGGSVISNSYAYTTGIWYHVAFTYDGTNSNFYVNGVSIGVSVNKSITPNTVLATAQVAYSIGDAGPFNGRIADARIYNAALTSGQIASVMTDSYSTGLQYQWKLDGNWNASTGTTALTPTNSPTFVNDVPSQLSPSSFNASPLIHMMGAGVIY